MSIYLHKREGKSQLNTWIVCLPCVFEQKAHNIQEESTDYATERCDKNLITYMKKNSAFGQWELEGEKSHDFENMLFFV